jgi:hypothetical protein
MTRVVLVGYEPETVDFSDPDLPPGMNAEKISAGLAFALEQMRERGWEADACLVRPDETAAPAVERHLAAAKNCQCVVIGAGIRLPRQGLQLFETILNAIHRAAPKAAIAFNTRPDDSADAAARWLPQG